MKKYSSLFLVLLLMVFLVGTTAMVNAETTLRFVNWASAEKVTRDQIENVIEAFEKANPGIKVESIPVPFGQIRQQVVTMVAGGNAPDIIQVSSNMPFELAAMGSLEPINNYASDAYIADNWQGALEAGTYNGELYAVPWGINYFGFWYNKNLMKEAGLDPNTPPKTWTQFMEALDKVNENLADNVDAFELFTAKAQYGVTHNWSLFWAFNAFPLENEEIGINTDEMKAYLSWMRKMVQDNYTTGGYKLREFREEFAKNRLVFAFDGPYMNGIVKSLNPDITDEDFNNNYGVTSIPAGVHGDALTAIDIHQLVMSKQSKDKEAAWKFMKFLTSSDIAIEEYLLPYGSILPLKSSVNNTHSEYFKDSISQAYINEIIPTGRPIPYGPKWGQGAEFIMDAIQAAVMSDQAIDEIAENLENNLSVIYKW